MTNSTQNHSLSTFSTQDAHSPERMSEQQITMFEHLDKRLNQLSEQVRTAAKPPRKDIWDRLGALAPMISAAIIACTGAYFTYTYNQQQLRVQEIQTIEKFFPHLTGDEKSKRAAILAINSLGDPKLAAKVASIFASEGTASALSSMARTTPNEDKAAIREALLKTLTDLYGTQAVQQAENTLVKTAGEKPGATLAGSETTRATGAEKQIGERQSTPRVSGSSESSSAAQNAASGDDAKAERAGQSKSSQSAAQEPAPQADSQRIGVEAVHPEEHDPRANAHTGVEQ